MSPSRLHVTYPSLDNCPCTNSSPSTVNFVFSLSNSKDSSNSFPTAIKFTSPEYNSNPSGADDSFILYSSFCPSSVISFSVANDISPFVVVWSWPFIVNTVSFSVSGFPNKSVFINLTL